MSNKELLSVKYTITNFKECINEIRNKNEKKQLFKKVINIHDKCLSYESINNIMSNTELNKNCNCIHEIENDYIDVSPEQSMPIKYCKRCFLTF